MASEGVPTKPAAMPYPPADPPPILKYLKGQVRLLNTISTYYKFYDNLDLMKGLTTATENRGKIDI